MAPMELVHAPAAVAHKEQPREVCWRWESSAGSRWCFVAGAELSVRGLAHGFPSQQRENHRGEGFFQRGKGFQLVLSLYFNVW